MNPDLLTVLADPTRRSIYEHLVAAPQSVGSLAAGMPVSRPAVSQHLKILGEAGLVEVRQQGTRRIYSARPEGLAELRTWVETMWETALDRFQEAAIKQHERTSK